MKTDIWHLPTDIPNITGDIIFFTKDSNNDLEIHFGRIDYRTKLLVIPVSHFIYKWDEVIKWTWTNDYIKQFDFLTQMCELKEDCNKAYIKMLEKKSSKIERLEEENNELKQLLYDSLPAVRMFTNEEYVELKNKITKIMENNNAK